MLLEANMQYRGNTPREVSTNRIIPFCQASHLQHLPLTKAPNLLARPYTTSLM